MKNINLSGLAIHGDSRALLLTLLHEVFQLQRDLLEIRQALGITRLDELPVSKTEEWDGNGTPF